jgi:hypothetical protein
MKTKIIREKIPGTYDTICNLLNRGGKQDFKFNYAVIKNKEKLEKVAIDIRIEMQKIDLERDDLCRKYCEKDEDNKPIIENNKYKGLDGHEEFEKEIEKWRKKKEDFSSKEITIEGYEIPMSSVPQQLEGVYQEAIMPFLNMGPNQTKSKAKDKEIKVN